MANPYFTPSGAPPTQTRGISASMRGEFNAIGTGFDGVYAQLVALAAAIGVPVTVTEVPVSSGSTTDIGNGYGPVISITGTTTINSFGANYNGAKFIRFTGILTLTNSASLVLPGGSNITTAAGDACIAIPIGNPASGWRVLSYCRMSKPMLDDDAIRASVSYSNPSWLTALAWSKISGTPTTRAGYGIVDSAGNGNNSDITSLSGLSGNVAFTGTGNRITGDFSNATVASRVALQTSITNSGTLVNALPSGTATSAAWMAINSSSPANSAYGALWATSVDVRLDSGVNGTAGYLPLTIYAAGAEAVRVDTSRNVGIGTTATSGYRLDVAGFIGLGTKTAAPGQGGLLYMRNDTGVLQWQFGLPGNAGATDLFVYNTAAGAERFRFGAAGQFGIAGANYGVVGQNVFSGGASAAPSWSSLAGVGGAFRAHRSTNQTSGTTLIFDTVDNQNGSGYNNTTGVFTASAAGWYCFEAGVYAANTSGGAQVMNFTISASSGVSATCQNPSVPNAGGWIDVASLRCYLTAGQTVSVGASWISATQLVTGSQSSFFSGCYLGA
jgi:hypothetical protein